jgi:PhnB protein
MSDMYRGIGSVSAYLCADGAAEAIEFYKRVFDGVERHRETVATGEISHSEISIGDTTVLVADEYPVADWYSPKHFEGLHSSALVLKVDDVDATVRRAVEGGANITRELADADYGRWAQIVDPFGHRWLIIAPAAA